MNKKFVAIGLAVFGLVVFALSFAVPNQPPVAGADGAIPVTLLSWKAISSLLSLFGFGSIVTAVNMFLTKASPFVEQVRQYFPTTNGPSVQIVPNPKVDDPLKPTSPESELVLAVLAYVARKAEGDKFTERRFISAAITELSEILAKRSPELGDSMNILAIAIVNDQFPATKPTSDK